jgi:hypothetical protein
MACHSFIPRSTHTISVSGIGMGQMDCISLAIDIWTWSLIDLVLQLKIMDDSMLGS